MDRASKQGRLPALGHLSLDKALLVLQATKPRRVIQVGLFGNATQEVMSKYHIIGALLTFPDSVGCFSVLLFLVFPI